MCTSCTTGLYFDSISSSCQPCDSSCLSCTTTATTCLICYPGFTFNNLQQCSLCPSNCFNCSSNTTCNQCDKGYGLTSSGVCRKCLISCSQCNPNNITECIGCAAGLQLVNGKCQSCPENCIECSGTNCITCSDGYTPNSNSICVLKCELPCVNCVDNQPRVCTTCQYGTYLDSSQCILNTTCNSDNTCAYCGQGCGYYLVPVSGNTGYCSQCPTILNCLQCN